MKYFVIMSLVFIVSCQSDCEEKLKNAYLTIATMEGGQSLINDKVAGIIDNVRVLWKEETELLNMVNSTPDDVIEKLDIINFSIKKANSKIIELQKLMNSSGFQNKKFDNLRNQLKNTQVELGQKEKEIENLRNQIESSNEIIVDIGGRNDFNKKYTISYQNIIDKLDKELKKVKNELKGEQIKNQKLIDQKIQLINDIKKKDRELKGILSKLAQQEIEAKKNIENLKKRNKATIDSLKKTLKYEKAKIQLEIARDLVSDIKNVRRRKRGKILKIALNYYAKIKQYNCGIDVDYEVDRIKKDYRKYLK